MNSDTLEKFEEFDNFERKEGQSIYEFVSMFDFRYRKLEKKKMKIPSEILAFKLLKKANLTRQENLLILTGMNFDNRGSFFEEAKKALKKYKGCCMKIKSSSQNVMLDSTLQVKDDEAVYADGYIRAGGSSQDASADKGVSWKSEHARDTYTSVGGSWIKESVSKGNKNKVKRINPTGSDGFILKCYSCGSFRHLLENCPDSWENILKTNSDEGGVEFGDEAQMISEEEQIGSSVIVKLKHEVASLEKQNGFLKCELKEMKADIYRQLETEAGDDKGGLGPQPALEHGTRAGMCINKIRESSVQKQNKRTKRKQQKQPVDFATELASKQIEILGAKIEEYVSLLKTQMDSLSNKQKQMENMLSGDHKESLSGVLENWMPENETHNIRKFGTIHNELKKKTKYLIDVQEAWRERRPERDTIRSTIQTKSGEVVRNVEGSFWRFNKRGEDERRLQQIVHTSVQSTREEHEEKDIGTINALAVKKQTLLNPAVRRIPEMNANNQIIRHSNDKQFADPLLFRTALVYQLLETVSYCNYGVSLRNELMK